MKRLLKNSLFLIPTAAFLPLPLISLKCETNKEIKNENQEKSNPNALNKLLSKSIILNNVEYEFSDEFKHNKTTQVSLKFTKDGDTADFLNHKTNKEVVTVRFAGIDTPEKSKRLPNGKRIPTTGVQFKYATLASKHTKNRLEEAKKIWIIPQKTKSFKKDTKYSLTDKYGRIIGIVVILTKENELICLNKELVELGFAKMRYISRVLGDLYYTENTNYYDWIKKAEGTARKENKGFWKENVVQIFPKN
ncbi:Hypothetical protein, putative nuclease [Metamycoplasma auris 15026]|uniref:TNase-like domain-containing protein n=1 Tax=Metamycoplasma auris 15026 TaxID=1188233 RepID=N9VCI7_9BACT|nr:thermonuclease family protein [Metamycoplasma auris]ENY69116.1 Hypothetical protein, putative nuclease [Metamycoplasma auris 15026]